MTELHIIKEPDVCPYCGFPTTKRELLVGLSKDIFCSNENCPERVKQHICYFISKGCMNVDDCGSSTVDLLIKTGLLSSFKDLYNISIDEFIWVAGMTPYSSEKLYNNIKKSKQNADAATILYSVGIQNIGKITAEKILNIFGSIENVYNFIKNKPYDKQRILIDEIGEVATESLITYEYPDDLMWFVNNGFNTTYSNSSDVKSDKLKNLRILASGTFDNYSRDEIKNVIIENGGIYASGVNKKLDILVCGKNMGPSKLDKARTLGIKMITEQEFINML